MSDRLALSNAIEDAGIPRDKAQNLASVIINIVQDNAATKADVQASAAVLMAAITRLEGKVDLITPRVLLRVGAMTSAIAGGLFAALHYWPPHVVGG
jgi:hypothetical protein